MATLLTLATTVVGSHVAPVRAAEMSKPNIVYILADDLGYGDTGCYNPASKIPTPNIDRLAKAGVQFTDAHSPSAVCTPTRYALFIGSSVCCRSVCEADAEIEERRTRNTDWLGD